MSFRRPRKKIVSGQGNPPLNTITGKTNARQKFIVVVVSHIFGSLQLACHMPNTPLSRTTWRTQSKGPRSRPSPPPPLPPAAELELLRLAELAGFRPYCSMSRVRTSSTGVTMKELTPPVLVVCRWVVERKSTTTMVKAETEARGVSESDGHSFGAMTNGFVTSRTAVHFCFVCPSSRF